MKEQQEGIVDKIWRIFSSMKLGLALLGVIAFVSGIGTFFPQMNQDPTKAQAVGEIWQVLGFTHLFSTFWFRLLLGLLCINLIVCSVQRFQGIYNRTFKPQPPDRTSNVPKKVQQVWTAEGDSLKCSVNKVLKSKGFKVTLREQENDWSVIGIKRRWGNWGSFISHLSFVVLVLGAFLGSAMGFKGYFMAGAGTSIPIQSIQVSKGVVKENFNVRINSAEDRFLPNGERDNWYTDLSILQDNKVVATHTISVNHPFTYDGVTFYQSNFADGAKLNIEQKGKISPVILQAGGGNYYQAPGTDLYLVAAGIQSQGKTTSMLYQVYQGTGLQLVQSGQLNLGQTIDVQKQYKLTLVGSAGYTGLEVKKDPGVGVIWLGCALLLIGLMLSFYWRPVIVSGFFQGGNGNQGEFTFGMVTGKVSNGVQDGFDHLVNDLRQ